MNMYIYSYKHRHIHKSSFLLTRENVHTKSRADSYTQNYSQTSKRPYLSKYLPYPLLIHILPYRLSKNQHTYLETQTLHIYDHRKNEIELNKYSQLDK